MKKNIYNSPLLLFLIVSILSFSEKTFAQNIEFTSEILVLENEIVNNGSSTAAKESNIGSVPTTTGSTVAQFSVSPSGAATYSIPFSLPPGIKNMIPNVGLSYNSQSGNGVAGWGWSIAGLSSINRIAATKFHDNIIDPVDFDENDRFSLDGQRLQVKSGSYGGNGSVYETEKYSNIKIIASGTSAYGSSYGPSSFVVYYPDGSRAWYGEANSSSRMEWALYRKEDTQGNYIEYNYTNSEGVLYVDTVKYGSNGTDAAINEIDFSYKNKSRSDSYYVFGYEFNKNLILDKVEVKGNGHLYRTYHISHRTSSLNYEKIESVTEKNAVGESFSPITFHYKEDEVNVDVQQIKIAASSEDTPNTFAGDFNGDGNINLGTYDINQKEFRVFSGLGDDLKVFKKNTSEKIKQVFGSTTLSQDNKILNEKTITTVSDGSNYTIDFKVYRLSDNGATYDYSKNLKTSTYVTTSCSDGAVTYQKPMKFVSGDFNGDGLTDVFAYGIPYKYRTKHSNLLGINCYSEEHDGVVSGNYFIDLKRTATNYSSNTGGFNVPYSDGDRVKVGDFNGDGKTDIFHFTAGKVYIYSLNEDKFLQILHVETNSYLKLDRPILLGDFNGDGKTDFTTAVNSWEWRFFISKGNGFMVNDKNIGMYYKQSYKTTETYWKTPGGFRIHNPTYERFYVAQDFNNDGKTDFIAYLVISGSVNVEVPDNVMKMETFENIGDLNFESFYSSRQVGVLGRGVKKGGLPLVINVNDSRHNSEFIFLNNDRVRFHSYTYSNKNVMTLENIQNNSVLTNINYQRLGVNLESEESIYLQDNNEIYPYKNINVSVGTNLVKDIEMIGSGVTQIQEYKYGGAVSHIGGLGFLGFKFVKKTNIHGEGVSRLWNVSNFDVHNRGRITSNFLATSSSNFEGSYINRTDYLYDSSLSSNGVYDNLPNTITTVDALQGITVTKSIDYDSYHNPETITNTFTGGSKTQAFVYYNNASALDENYHIGRSKSLIETNILGSETFATEQKMTYENNLVKTIMKKGNGNTGWLTETYDYNALGNITKKILSASGVASREESFHYDSTNRFLKKSIDIEGLETTYDYYPNWDLKKVTNPFNMTVEYTYDSWGRIDTEKDHMLNITDYSYNKTSMTNEAWVLEKTVNFPDGGKSTSYTNAFGWLLQTKEKSINNKNISKLYEYDALGRKTGESEPTFSDTANDWSRFGYDTYGRLVSENYYMGKVVNTNYSNLSTTVNDGIKSKKITRNPVGNIVKVTDPGGTINYTYYANGSIKQANYGSHVVSTEIDGWGRKTKLNDPSAGEYSYSYNIWGELLSEITPKGTTSYFYDEKGKLKNKNIVGDLTNLSLIYDYNESTDKLLNKITGTDGIENTQYIYTYMYTAYKQPKLICEITPTAYFVKEFKYGDFGEVKTERYTTTHTVSSTSSDIVTTNLYDAGILKEIFKGDKVTDESKSLWKVTEESARGNAMSITLGNGIVKTKKYDAFGFLEEIHDSKDEIDALKMSYTFNAQRGTLTERTNFGFENWKENFEYDALSRLRNITGAVTHTKIYDESGRIVTNNDIGKYNYNSSKIYQLANIELNAAGDTHFDNYAPQQISYNAFKKPISINNDGKARVDFVYGPLQNRTHAYYGGAQTDKNQRQYHKHYSSVYPVEIVNDKVNNTVKIINYIGGDGYKAPIAHIKQTGSNPIDEFHYLHRDYLGSILAITDSIGTVKEQRQFGVWGKVDKFVDSDGNTTFGHSSLIGRGYTGHEHFFEVNLIHMNGRMYDANLGRFLSPDNNIQDPFNTQNYNRYGYVLNNPLKYSDWTGETYHNESPPVPVDGWLFYLSHAILSSLFGTTSGENVGNVGDVQSGIGGNQDAPVVEMQKFEESTASWSGQEFTPIGFGSGTEGLMTSSEPVGRFDSSGFSHAGLIASAVGNVAEYGGSRLSQRNLFVFDATGTKIGKWSITSKSAAKSIAYTKTLSNAAGYLAGGGAIVSDYMAYSHKDITGARDISGARFSYRTAFNIGGIVLAGVGSGGWSFAVGVIGYGGESCYDSWIEDIQPAMQTTMPTGGALRFPYYY